MEMALRPNTSLCSALRPAFLLPSGSSLVLLLNSHLYVSIVNLSKLSFIGKDLVEEEEVGSYASRQKAMDEHLKAIGIAIEAEDVVTRKYLSEVTHVFSHIKQALHVEYISVVKLSQTPVADKNLQWVKAEGMESLAMSKGMKKCFDLLNKDKKGAKPKAAKGGDAAKAKNVKAAEPPKMAKIDSFFKPKK